MKKDIKTIIVIIAILFGIIAFNQIKTKTHNQIVKGISFLCKNSKGEIAFKY